MLSFLAFADYFLYYWKFTFFSKKISICFRVAFREPCAKNGFPPPRPFSSLFTCFTSSRTSPSLCPMAYFYPSLSFPAKKAATPLHVSKIASVHFLTSTGSISPSINSTFSFPTQEAAICSKCFCFSAASSPFKL